jgi:phage terminase large subunit-like protein
MAANCAVRENQNGNIMPSKRKSAGRIDGITATIIVISWAVSEPCSSSDYVKHELPAIYQRFHATQH